MGQVKHTVVSKPFYLESVGMGGKGTNRLPAGRVTKAEVKCSTDVHISTCCLNPVVKTIPILLLISVDCPLAPDIVGFSWKAYEAGHYTADITFS